MSKKLVPFSRNGTQLEYDKNYDPFKNNTISKFHYDPVTKESNQIFEPIIFKENNPFQATLKISPEAYRGRSAVRFKFINTENKEIYTCNLNNFMDIISNYDIIDNKLTGKFYFVKHGSNWSLARYNESS